MSSVVGIPAPADNELLRVLVGNVISPRALIDFDVVMDCEAHIDFDVTMDIVAQGSYVYCNHVCVRTRKRLKYKAPQSSLSCYLTSTSIDIAMETVNSNKATKTTV